MSEQKTIEQYAKEYADLNYLMANNEYAVNDFLAGAAKQKELDLEIIKKLEAKLRNMVKAPEPEICGDTY